MENILSFTLKDLEEKEKPKFRAKQIYNWIYVKYQFDFEKMENLPKDFRQELKENYSVLNLKEVNKQKSSDESIKYLFELEDGHTVETVLLKMKEVEVDENGEVLKEAKYTVCISTQVGCKVGCAFCLTAKGGFVRDLTPGEIVGQMLYIKRDNNFPMEKAVNMVYMGMGEPLDNLENVAKAIEIFSEKNGMNISPKRQTISTSGISSKIDKLGEMNLGVQLAISLHAVDDITRDTLIPMNKAFPIKSIIDAVKKFPIDTRKRVMFEYLVIGGINDDVQHAKALIKLLEGIKAKVNLIYFNPYEDTKFKRPSKKSMIKFQDYLSSRGITCTIRASKGLDISAACGQLREQNDNVSRETSK